MSLTNSNTYIEPVSGAALNTARGQFNNSMRSLLTNFKSTSAPATTNITYSGANAGEQDGMLFRSATTNALYISDSVHVKSSPVGGNFTRIGIGNRVENGIVALGANAASYEIGELVATVSEDGSLSSNARLYLCTSNTVTPGSTARFLDIGAPQGYSIGTNDNVTFSGQSVTSIRFLATSNVGINTTSPSHALDVNGNAVVHTSIHHRGDTDSYIGWAAADTFVAYTNGSERFRIQSDGNVAVGTTVANTALEVNGTVTAVDFNSTSDRALKTNIQKIPDAMNKLNQINGYSFNYINTDKKSVGVIAQEIESVLPELVDGVEGRKTVAYGNLVGLLIEAIKELSDKIETLEKGSKY